MDKESLSLLLEEKYETLFSWLEQQPLEKWETGPEGKWTTGQHTKHLLQSITPLNTAMSLPKFILKFKYGKSNRAVRDYDTVTKRYQERLEGAKGLTYKGSMNMGIPKAIDKDYFITRLKVEYKKLQYKSQHWSDPDLDNYILPHPLMGKMPIRELLMWNAYHLEHHTKTLMKKY